MNLLGDDLNVRAARLTEVSDQIEKGLSIEEILRLWDERNAAIPEFLREELSVAIPVFEYTRNLFYSMFIYQRAVDAYFKD